MKKLENKGITLIALVVTIIVLIILAGVSISLVLGQDGVVQKAKSGRDNYAEAARLENEQLANVDAFAMDIEAMIPSSPSETPQGTATGTITNMTGGDLEISATVSLSANTNLERTKYVFTTSSSALGTNDESLYKDGTVEQANGEVKATKKAGTYYLHVLATDTNGGKTEIISEQTATSQGKKDFDYTGNIKTITLSPGNYTIETWGASAGYIAGYENKCGHGAYAISNITITSYQEFKILVGGRGVPGSSQTYTIGSQPGGGGTFVASITNEPYCIAGGGGGKDTTNAEGTYTDTAYIYCNGQNTKLGGTGHSGSRAQEGYGGPTNAAGSNYGAGGGGFYSNGTAGNRSNSGGTAFINGGTSISGDNNCVAGFGGGGMSYSRGGNSAGGAGGRRWLYRRNRRTK